MKHDQSNEERAPPQNDSTTQTRERKTGTQPSQQDETTTQNDQRADVAPAEKRPDKGSVSVADLFPTTEFAFTPEVTTMEKSELPEEVRSAIDSPTQTLDPSIQTALNQAGGQGLGNVYVHTGTKAAQAAEKMDARAFTLDNHIIFNRDEYDPTTPEGKAVLAHELTAINQNEGTVSILRKDAAVPTPETATHQESEKHEE